jgi:glycosyltransferase involved in cell wall biosynthesis
MKIIQVHNWHRYGGGADAVVEATTRLLRERGHEAILFTRDSRKLGKGLSGRMRAFVCGIYSSSGRSAMEKLLRENKPDIVHVHELYPFISPWALVECKRAGVPVVMTCHDYQLSCPITQRYRRGVNCDLCAGGREYWCALKNCRSNIFESIGYALRGMLARNQRLFLDNVTRYMTASEFVKQWLVGSGCPEESVTVVPYSVSIPRSDTDPPSGKYVAYAGRFDPVKGIATLLTSVRRTGLPLCLAGDYSPMPEIIKMAPPNAQFMGHLGRQGLASFYRKARLLVVPSTCLEAFGLVSAEAMAHGLPVIASRTGGIPEVVEDGKTGLLFEPGDAEELASKMRWLWERPDLCLQMGSAGREKAVREYSDDVYYQRLLAVYETTVKEGAATA